MSALTIVFLTIAALFAIHAVIFSMTTAWHTKRSHVLTQGEGATHLERIRDGLAKEAVMRANPPWYVRYTNRFFGPERP